MPQNLSISKIKKNLTLAISIYLLFISVNSKIPTTDQTHISTTPSPVSTSASALVQAGVSEQNQGFEAVVQNVVDGDTIKILFASSTLTTIRLIGIDTPETVDPRKPVQCFGKEASAKTKELLLGKKVRIELDSTQGTKDKYGRTLAYVYLESDASVKDELFFNKYMIEKGYAHEYTYDMPYKYQAEFKLAERAAREAGLGLWAPGVCVSRRISK